MNLAALYIRSGDILIMSGQSRTAFHAVPRIIKVGEVNEPPACLSWQHGLFDANMTSLPHPDESDVPDENKDILEVKDSLSCGNTSHSASTVTGSEKSKQSEKREFEVSCDSKIIREFESISIEGSEDCGCIKLDQFCGKSLRMRSLTAQEWRKFEVYLSKTRINVNVRQVHEKGKTVNSLCD